MQFLTVCGQTVLVFQCNIQYLWITVRKQREDRYLPPLLNGIVETLWSIPTKQVTLFRNAAKTPT
jgi:hypothetical protein